MAEDASTTLPIEIWHDIINLVCNHGKALWDGAVRRDMLSIQRTCKLLYAICTPILQQNVYITTGYDGLAQYCRCIHNGKFSNRHPSVFAVVEHAGADSSEAAVVGIQLHSIIRFDMTKRLMVMMGPNAFDVLRTSDTRIMEEYIGNLSLSSSLDPSKFVNMRRMTVLGGNLVQLCAKAVKLPMLEELLIIIPNIVLAHDWLSQHSAETARQSLRVTCIFPRARTINDSNFNLIQQRQDSIQVFHRGEMTLYLVNTAEPCASGHLDDQLNIDSPFRNFVTQGCLNGRIYDWCREHARPCGQETGLTVMPF